MKKKYNSFIKNGTWGLISRLYEANIIYEKMMYYTEERLSRAYFKVQDKMSSSQLQIRRRI